MKNQAQIDEILALLTQHSDAHRALEHASRFSWQIARSPKEARPKPGPGATTPEIEWAKAQLAALPVPDRSEATEACRAELTQLSNRFEGLRIELVLALQKQMEAEQALAAAKIALQYAETVAILGISIKAARVALVAAEKRFGQAQTYMRTISNERTGLIDYFQTEYGTTPTAPASFASAAAGRVERLLGEALARRDETALLQRLGVNRLPPGLRISEVTSWPMK